MVISIPRLIGLLDDDVDWVLIDKTGSMLDLEVPTDIGPATLLVAPVTDAIKTVNAEGLIEQSLDREAIWKVEGFALNRLILERLEPTDLSPTELLDAVAELESGWEFKELAELA